MRAAYKFVTLQINASRRRPPFHTSSVVIVSGKTCGLLEETNN